jgi:hypothetical protein
MNIEEHKKTYKDRYKKIWIDYIKNEIKKGSDFSEYWEKRLIEDVIWRVNQINKNPSNEINFYQIKECEVLTEILNFVSYKNRKEIKFLGNLNNRIVNCSYEEFSDYEFKKIAPKIYDFEISKNWTNNKINGNQTMFCNDKNYNIYIT